MDLPSRPHSEHHDAQPERLIGTCPYEPRQAHLHVMQDVKRGLYRCYVPPRLMLARHIQKVPR